jgi:hypothetical protein
MDVDHLPGELEMSASSEVRRIAVRTGVLICGVFVLTVFLSAMPGHRVPIVDAQSSQQDSMQGMDHGKMQMSDADEQASEKDAMSDMAHTPAMPRAAASGPRSSVGWSTSIRANRRSTKSSRCTTTTKALLGQASCRSILFPPK